MNKSLTLISGALAVSACTTANSAPPASIPPSIDGSTCDAANVQSYLGSMVTQELGATILRETGSRILRWAPPRSALTMDYRTDRVTISYDDQRTINAIRCG